MTFYCQVGFGRERQVDLLRPWPGGMDEEEGGNGGMVDGG